MIAFAPVDLGWGVAGSGRGSPPGLVSGCPWSLVGAG